MKYFGSKKTQNFPQCKGDEQFTDFLRVKSIRNFRRFDARKKLFQINFSQFEHELLGSQKQFLHVEYEKKIKKISSQPCVLVCAFTCKQCHLLLKRLRQLCASVCDVTRDFTHQHELFENDIHSLPILVSSFIQKNHTAILFVQKFPD